MEVSKEILPYRSLSTNEGSRRGANLALPGAQALSGDELNDSERTFSGSEEDRELKNDLLALQDQFSHESNRERKMPERGRRPPVSFNEAFPGHLREHSHERRMPVNYGYPPVYHEQDGRPPTSFNETYPEYLR